MTDVSATTADKLETAILDAFINGDLPGADGLIRLLALTGEWDVA